MTNWRELRALAAYSGGRIERRRGDVPVVTRGGVIQVCSEDTGYDIWCTADDLHLVATNVSKEVAVTYLRRNAA